MIYFVKSGDFIKIGKADDPNKRLAQFQTGNPEPLEMLAIIDGSHAKERAIHAHFSSYRVGGEWFRDCDEIRAFAKNPVFDFYTQPQVARRRQTDSDGDSWRFELKRKPRKATRKNAGSTALDKWYYWVVRIRSDGRTMYYGTLEDVGVKP